MAAYGRYPHDFTGATDTVAKMAVVAATHPPRIHDVAPHVRNYVAVALETAMARDPADRYATVTDLAAALGRRPAVTVRWRQTNEHPGHLACWRGERAASAGPYLVCMENGIRPTQRDITTSLANSGRRVRACCRTTPTRNWAQSVRTVIRDLS